jgi:DivIVA domain-containing protein
MTVLTPTDVRNIAFRKPPLGRRGYDEDEVDSFLDRVEASLTVLYQEITRLREDLAAVRSPAATPGTHQWAVAPEATGYAQPSGARNPSLTCLSRTTVTNRLPKRLSRRNSTWSRDAWRGSSRCSVRC